MFKRFRTLISSSLRYKLLILVLLPVLLVLLAVTSLAYYWLNEVSYRQLLREVTDDLNVANEAFINTQNRYLAELALFSESYQFQHILKKNLSREQEIFQIQPLLDDLKTIKGFDFIQVMDSNSCNYLDNRICDIKKSPLYNIAIYGVPATGVEIFSAEDLQALSPELAEEVYLPLIQTQYSEPTANTFEDRGMVLHSYYPIMDETNRVKLILIGGVLLNRNFVFVDTLRDLVYSKGSLQEDSLGTVTIFLDDVRISTNVPGQLHLPSQRALGTRVSKEVRKKVLTDGEHWIDRAFVVSEWYISAYEPIYDVYNNRIGMLYTGFLEAPFRATYFTGLTVLLILFVSVISLSIFLAIVGAKFIYKPIEIMTNVIETIKEGEERRIGQLDSQDELSILARQFDDMLDQLQQHRDQIQNAADELELKVEDRTYQLKNQKLELEQNIVLLKQTREKLVVSEKLAVIGELTAGIAHEINNPTAVILGNMDLLIQELGQQANSVNQETELIIQQVYRIRSIINNLLLYSRPNDYYTAWTPVDINAVVNDALVLVHHDLNQHSVNLRLDLCATKNVKGNHQQFQQVLLNLIVNAMHAIENKGQIVIRTRDWKDEGVLMMIRDNGCGIDDETLPRIFDPFFTRTKSGTGLGLYICYGILKRFGAEIAVRSRIGVGTCFFVWFYENPIEQFTNNSIAVSEELDIELLN